MLRQELSSTGRQAWRTLRSAACSRGALTHTCAAGLRSLHRSQSKGRKNAGSPQSFSKRLQMSPSLKSHTGARLCLPIPLQCPCKVYHYVPAAHIATSTSTLEPHGALDKSFLGSMAAPRLKARPPQYLLLQLEVSRPCMRLTTSARRHVHLPGDPVDTATRAGAHRVRLQALQVIAHRAAALGRQRGGHVHILSAPCALVRRAAALTLRRAGLRPRC